MCDLGGEGEGVWEMSHHTPLSPPRKENKKKVVISTDFEIMCFFVLNCLRKSKKN